MGVDTVQKAAELLSRYGNVGEAQQLLDVKPTEGEILEAARVAHRQVETSVYLLMVHHGMNPGFRKPPPDPSRLTHPGC